MPTYDIIINVCKYMIKHDASGFSLVQKNFVKVPLDVTLFVSFPSEYDQCLLFVAILKYQVTHLSICSL